MTESGIFVCDKLKDKLKDKNNDKGKYKHKMRKGHQRRWQRVAFG